VPTAVRPICVASTNDSIVYCESINPPRFQVASKAEMVCSWHWPSMCELHKLLSSFSWLYASRAVNPLCTCSRAQQLQRLGGASTPTGETSFASISETSSSSVGSHILPSAVINFRILVRAITNVLETIILATIIRITFVVDTPVGPKHRLDKTGTVAMDKHNVGLAQLSIGLLGSLPILRQAQSGTKDR
jgi:hypothetical protein